MVVELRMIFSTGSGFPPGNETAVVSSGALPVLALGLTPVILQVVVDAELSASELVACQIFPRHFLEFGVVPPLETTPEVSVLALSVEVVGATEVGGLGEPPSFLFLLKTWT